MGERRQCKEQEKVKVWEGQEGGEWQKKKPRDAFRESQTASDGEQRRDYGEQERGSKK